MKRPIFFASIILLSSGCDLIFGSSNYEQIPTQDHPVRAIYPDPPAATQVIEEFPLPIKQKVDLLLAIDNSCSMGGLKQAQLAIEFPMLLDAIQDSGWNWRIGVISLDVDRTTEQGTLHLIGQDLWMDNSTGTTDQEFTDTVVIGTDGRGRESGFDAIWMSAEFHDDPQVYPSSDGMNCYWYDSTGDGELNEIEECFMRPAASFHVIVISDERDQSTLSRLDFVNWMRALKPDSNNVSFSIIGWGFQFSYKATATDLNGYIGAIFGDWVSAIDDMSEIFTTRSNTFQLMYRPVISSLTVSIVNNGNQDILGTGICDYCASYNPIANEISLHGYTPIENDRVRIEYIDISTVPPGH